MNLKVKISRLVARCRFSLLAGSIGLGRCVASRASLCAGRVIRVCVPRSSSVRVHLRCGHCVASLRLERQVRRRRRSSLIRRPRSPLCAALSAAINRFDRSCAQPHTRHTTATALTATLHFLHAQLDDATKHGDHGCSRSRRSHVASAPTIGHTRCDALARAHSHDGDGNHGGKEEHKEATMQHDRSDALPLCTVGLTDVAPRRCRLLRRCLPPAAVAVPLSAAVARIGGTINELQNRSIWLADPRQPKTCTSTIARGGDGTGPVRKENLPCPTCSPCAHATRRCVACFVCCAFQFFIKGVMYSPSPMGSHPEWTWPNGDFFIPVRPCTFALVRDAGDCTASAQRAMSSAPCRA